MIIAFLALRYFNNTVMDYLIFLSIVAAGYIAAKAIYWIIQKIIKRYTGKTKNNLDDVIVDMIEEPAVVYFMLFMINIAWQFLEFPDYPRVQVYYGHIMYMLFVLNTAWLASRLLNAIIDNVLKPFAQKSDTELDDHLLPIVSKAINIITFAIAIIMILHHFGQEIGPMLAGLGIGGLAFALAAKDLLANFFGSVTILFDKPFSIGQRIKILGFDGTVQEINLRTTKIQTLDGTIVYIPNSKFTESAVENVTQEWARKVKMDIGLVYDTNAKGMENAKTLIKDILASTKGINNEKSMVYFTEFGDFAKKIMVVYWITDKDQIFQIRDQVNMQIMERFDKARLSMAFPTQTIEIKK